MTETYHPVHFFECEEHARKHGLQYLSGALLPPPTDPAYRQDVRSALESAADDVIVKHEQTLDYMRAHVPGDASLQRGAGSAA
jgi:hypothetical protein